MKIKILIPIYNDWRSLFELLKNIDQQTKIPKAQSKLLPAHVSIFYVYGIHFGLFLTQRETQEYSPEGP